MKLVKFSSIIFLFFLSSFLFISKTHSQEEVSTSSVIYFYQSNCSHCNNLDNIILENNLENYLNIQRKDISLSDNYEFFSLVAEKCGEEKYTPFIYYNENCYVGTTYASDLLLNIAGLSTSTSSNIIDNSDTIQNTNIKVLIDSSNNINNLNNPAINIPDVNILEIIIMILAPIVFVVMAYLIITRLKL